MITQLEKVFFELFPEMLIFSLDDNSMTPLSLNEIEDIECEIIL